MMTSSHRNIFRVTGPLCGEFTGPGEFPTQRPVTRSFNVFFDLRLNKPLSKQSWGWWFETLSRSLWRHRNGGAFFRSYINDNKNVSYMRSHKKRLLVWLWKNLLTHLPLEKMAAVSQTIFSDAFSCMKSFAFWFKFHWRSFLRDNNPALVQIMAWRGIGELSLDTGENSCYWKPSVLNPLEIMNYCLYIRNILFSLIVHRGRAKLLWHCFKNMQVMWCDENTSKLSQLWL